MICRENSQIENSCSTLFKRLIKSLSFCMILCMVFILAISLIVTYTDVSETIISPFVNIMRMFAILLSSIIFTFGQKTRGWLKGIISGGLFCAILYAAGLIFIEDYTNISNSLKMFTGGILIGMTGGIIGINLGIRRKI